MDLHHEIQAIKKTSRLEERNLDLKLPNDVRWNLIGVKMGGNAATSFNLCARHQKDQPQAWPHAAWLLKDDPKVWPEKVTLPKNDVLCPLIEPVSVISTAKWCDWEYSIECLRIEPPNSKKVKDYIQTAPPSVTHIPSYFNIPRQPSRLAVLLRSHRPSLFLS